MEAIRPAYEAKRIDLDITLNQFSGTIYGDADRLQASDCGLQAWSLKPEVKSRLSQLVIASTMRLKPSAD